jgi:hypothetical protein
MDGIDFSLNPVKSIGMTTMLEFGALSFEKKCDLVTYQGQYLGCRILSECKVFLYSIEDFFIEVFYSPKYEKVLMINAFDEARGLTPYLERISLADLYSRPIN